MRPAKLVLAVLVAVAAIPRVGHAQIGFEGAIANITDINFFFSCWRATGQIRRTVGCPATENGYGVEILYDLGDVDLPWVRRIRRPAGWVPTARSKKCADGRCAETADSVWKVGDTSAVYVARLEFALNYSQFSGFTSADTSFDLRGSVRELPGVTMYATLGADSTGWQLYEHVNPYVGIRSGLIQLNGVQILDHYKPDSLVAYSGSGVSFQIGAVAGVALSCCQQRVTLFGEGAWMLRTFPNVPWAAAGTNRVLSKFPTSLDFSGLTYSFGVQFNIREPK